MHSEIEAHVFISGIVQGVFFRANTMEMARELKLSGWVKNLPDGRVEAIFQGDENKVKKMIEWCHKGPRFARVSKVDVEIRGIKDKLQGFEIRY